MGCRIDETTRATEVAIALARLGATRERIAGAHAPGAGRYALPVLARVDALQRTAIDDIGIDGVEGELEIDLIARASLGIDDAVVHDFPCETAVDASVDSADVGARQDNVGIARTDRVKPDIPPVTGTNVLPL